MDYIIREKYISKIKPFINKPVLKEENIPVQMQWKCGHCTFTPFVLIDNNFIVV